MLGLQEISIKARDYGQWGHTFTIDCAVDVALLISELAPLVTFSGP